MSRPDYMFPLTADMENAARRVDGEAIDPDKLKPGDKFSFFQNEGFKISGTVYVFDEGEGFPYHDEETGEQGYLTGEVPVVRWLVPQIRLNPH